VKAKRQYEKSHRESEKALDAYRKSDADIHLSRADVEKVSMVFVFFFYIFARTRALTPLCSHPMSKR